MYAEENKFGTKVLS